MALHRHREKNAAACHVVRNDTPALGSTTIERRNLMETLIAEVHQAAPNVDSLDTNPHAPIRSVRARLPSLLINRDRMVLWSNCGAPVGAAPRLDCLLGHAPTSRGELSRWFDAMCADAFIGLRSHRLLHAAIGTDLNCSGPWRAYVGPAIFEQRPAALAIFFPPAAPSMVAEVSALFDLTPAESKVLDLVMRDCCPKQIAQSLGSSLHTVRAHLSAMFRKTGARGQCELVRFIATAAGC
jgi:DNA-binding CsgD family transcriptional regulator